MGCDLITESIVNQHNAFGVWEVRRAEILYALLDEFVSMTRDEKRCKEMEEALSDSNFVQ